VGYCLDNSKCFCERDGIPQNVGLSHKREKIVMGWDREVLFVLFKDNLL
jgi:hypothetical protein